MGGRILVCDDDAAIRTVVREALRRAGHIVETAASAADLRRTIRTFRPQVLLTDVVLPDGNGLDLVPELLADHPHMPIIVLSAQNTFTTAMRATEQGAFDYLPKPFDLGELAQAVEDALARGPALGLEDGAPAGEDLPLIGRSPPMQEVYRTIARLVGADLTVLLSGESGTGKELVARALHDNSARSKRPFVPVNCGAFTETLLESELFGHVRGSFTGAVNNHRGIFETASGGTIFLDEISETSPAFQVKLLRVLQEQEVRPVGATDARRADARIVAATNRRVQDLLAAEDFRRDLLYRLSVINIDLPPLRERREDIPLLVEHFLAQISSRLDKHVVAPPETIAWLTALDWPGNVRELENAVERAVTLNVGGRLLPDDFTQFTPTPLVRSLGVTSRLRQAPPEKSTNSWVCELPQSLAEVEREHILATLRYTRGNKLRAAELLGIGRYSLYRKAERLGIDLEAVSAETKHSA